MIDNFKYTIERDPKGENIVDWKAKLKHFQDQLAIWEARKAALKTAPTPTPTP
jgi:hypothetical protein